MYIFLASLVSTQHSHLRRTLIYFLSLISFPICLFLVICWLSFMVPSSNIESLIAGSPIFGLRITLPYYSSRPYCLGENMNESTELLRRGKVWCWWLSLRPHDFIKHQEVQEKLSTGWSNIYPRGKCCDCWNDRGVLQQCIFFRLKFCLICFKLYNIQSFKYVNNLAVTFIKSCLVSDPIKHSKILKCLTGLCSNAAIFGLLATSWLIQKFCSDFIMVSLYSKIWKTENV